MKDINLVRNFTLDTSFGDRTTDLVRAVSVWVDRIPNEPALGFLNEGSDDPNFISYGDLYARSLQLGARLLEYCNPGERVLILHQPGLSYVVTLLACMAARLIGVPAYPPRPKRGLERLSAIIRDAKPSIAVTDAPSADSLRKSLSKHNEFNHLLVITPEEADSALVGPISFDPPQSSETAYLQYTSGSTSDPRGVIVTHQNLIHNVFQIANRFRINSHSRGVIWLPPYHDMGLVGGILVPLVVGFPCLLMSPSTVIRSPLKWLQWIDRFRATISGGPNFAFDRALSIPVEQRNQLDLSTWEVAFTGAEPVNPTTLRSFTDAFKGCGFSSEALYPCYGLAESTLIVSGAAQKRTPLVRSFDPDQLASGVLIPCESGKPLVSCGSAVDDTIVKIVAPDDHIELAEGQIGEIWVSGPSVADGYWNRGSEHNRCFGAKINGKAQGDFLRTGDLGAIIDDELYIVGRIKELLIIRGKNFYPQDIEREIENALPVARTNGTAAFSIEIESVPKLSVAIELNRTAIDDNSESFSSLAVKAQQAVVDALEIRPDVVAFLRPGGLPRTSSGKLQRTQCAKLLESGHLPTLSVVRSASFTISPIEAESSESLSTENLDGTTRAHVSAAVKSLLARVGCEANARGISLESLEIVQVSALVEELFRIRLTTQELYSVDTIDSLEELIHSKLEFQPQPTEPNSEIGVVSHESLPEGLSEGQKSLWFIYKLSDNTAAYNAPFCMDIEGVVDIAALKAALEDVVLSHSALHSRFVVGEGEVKLIASDNTHLMEWSIVDVAELHGTERTEKIETHAWKPFRLESDSTLRAVLFKTSEHSHTLLLNVHHINVDFWSFQVILKDLIERYNARIDGRQPQFAREPKSNYARFVRWQQDYLDSPLSKTNGEYWAKQIEGISVLNLPFDNPRSVHQNYDGAALPLHLSPNLQVKLSSFCESQDLTMGMVLLSAYSLLLQYVSGQDDIVVGVPFSGRTRAEFADMVGYFVNPLPMRIRMNGEETISEFFSSVRQTLLDGIEHQNYPSSLLTKEMSRGADAASSSLFQTMMVLNRPLRLENDGSLAMTEDGRCQLCSPLLNLTEHKLRPRFTKFDLVLAALENNGQLSLSLQYNQDLLKESRVERFGRYFLRILEQLVDGSHTHLHSIDPMPVDEKAEIKKFGSGPKRDYEFSDNLVNRIERQSKQTPDATAVRFGESFLTYRQLDTWANAAAHRLTKLGVGKHSFAGVLVDRSLELPVSNLAVMKTGGAFVPLDHDWPIERLRRITNTCDLRTVIVTPANIELAKSIGVPVFVIDDWRDESNATLRISIDPEDPIYAFSTSGSTGEPKCAIVPHRGIVNRFEWMNEFFGVEVTHAVLQTTRQVYDSAVWQLFWPLINGGTSVIPDGDSLLDCEKFVNLIAHYEITMTDLVPSVFNTLLPQLLESDSTIERLRTLKSVIVGGEEITPESTLEFLKRFPEVQLTNLYGPTEASIGCIAYRVQPNHPGRIPIGRPIANVEIQLLDRWGRLVPEGTLGEIVIGGAAVGLGYAKNPEAISAVFSRNPTADGPFEMVYKSGDIARWLTDGNIDYCGRNDDQIKIRGHRIDLTEIELALRQHPGVASAIVTIYEPIASRKLLVAYVIGKQTSVDTDAIKNWVRQRLPSYMVPSSVVIMDKFPITAGGKLDRKSLPAPQLYTAYRAPQTETECALADLWQELLKMERIGLDDNFFELGGNSLMATQLVSRIESRMRIRLPLKQLFMNSTLSNLAQVVIEQSTIAEDPIIASYYGNEIDEEQLLKDLDQMDDAAIAELSARLLAEDEQSQ